MGRYISIDPGVEKVAYAAWNEDGTLISAGLVIHRHAANLPRADKWRDMAEWTDLSIGLSGRNLIIEIPQVYEDRKTDPNDLIDLAGVCGAIAAKVGMGEILWSPLPREWKGQLPKEISQKRVEEKLSDEEKKRIYWPIKSLKHNVYDALHLGLTFLEKKGLRSSKR